MKIQSVGVLTSGGDAPGMNAAVRAVTRASLYLGWKVYGIYRGWAGLMEGDIKEFTTESVSGIIGRGGTILKSARSKEFVSVEGRAKAAAMLKKFNIDALVVIGGDGSLTGAQDLASEHDIPVVGIPATIDNDLIGTNYTIGYDTALNTIVDAVDKIRDTATSHDRIFFIEVMGRDAGFLAQNSAIASGAEAAIIPEETTSIEQLAEFVKRGSRKSKGSSIVIVSEKDGGAETCAAHFREKYPEMDVKVMILGHLQRGGIPSASDRILASRFGVAAVRALMEGQRNVMVGIINGHIIQYPIMRAIQKEKKTMTEDVLYDVAILSL